MREVAYTVDLLFETGERNAPGSLHVKVMSPTTENRLSVVIEAGNDISIQENIQSMMAVLQKDIFNRIKADVNKDLNVYFILSDGQMNEFDGNRYIKMQYDDNGYQFDKVDEILY